MPGGTTMFCGMGERMTVIIEMAYELPVGNVVTVGAKKVTTKKIVRSATLISGRIWTPMWCSQVARQCSEGLAAPGEGSCGVGAKLFFSPERHEVRR